MGSAPRSSAIAGREVEITVEYVFSMKRAVAVIRGRGRGAGLEGGGGGARVLRGRRRGGRDHRRVRVLHEESGGDDQGEQAGLAHGIRDLAPFRPAAKLFGAGHIFWECVPYALCEKESP